MEFHGTVSNSAQISGECKDTIRSRKTSVSQRPPASGGGSCACDVIYTRQQLIRANLQFGLQDTFLQVSFLAQAWACEVGIKENVLEHMQNIFSSWRVRSISQAPSAVIERAWRSESIKLKVCLVL